MNNGLYDIYAFDAQQGVIRDSYASGSPDSGFYVGQCRHCNILVTGNAAERNAVGYEGANASDSVYIVGNRFSHNRVGLTLLSDYQEAFVPQRGDIVAGNVISENTSADSPEQADGGYGYDNGPGESGLLFTCFQNELRTFVVTQQQLDLHDKLMAFAEPTGSATFLILPGVTATRPLGAALAG